MFSASLIDSGTLQAYLDTEYHVLGQRGFTLRVGQTSAELLDAHARHEVGCSAFVTACNPHSQPTDEATNSVRQQQLAAELGEQQLVFVDGIGLHPSNTWPGEASFLVFGLSLEDARSLGVRHAQNAIVWSGTDGVPNLILLR